MSEGLGHSQKLRRLAKLGRIGDVLFLRVDGKACVVARCRWCETWLPWWDATVDHVVPQMLRRWLPEVRATTDGPRNHVIACQPCNLARAQALLDTEAGRAFALVTSLLGELRARIRQAEQGRPRRRAGVLV